MLTHEDNFVSITRGDDQTMTFPPSKGGGGGELEPLRKSPTIMPPIALGCIAWHIGATWLLKSMFH